MKNQIIQMQYLWSIGFEKIYLWILLLSNLLLGFLAINNKHK
jgi:hypothetical protein